MIIRTNIIMILSILLQYQHAGATLKELTLESKQNNLIIYKDGNTKECYLLVFLNNINDAVCPISSYNNKENQERILTTLSLQRVKGVKVDSKEYLKNAWFKDTTGYLYEISGNNLFLYNQHNCEILE